MIHYKGDTLRLTISIKQVTDIYKRFEDFEDVYIYIYTKGKTLAYSLKGLDSFEKLVIDDTGTHAIIFIDKTKSNQLEEGDMKILMRFLINTGNNIEQKTVIIKPGIKIELPDII